MKQTRWYLAAALAAVLLGAAGWTGYAQKQPAPRPTWEYRTVHVESGDLQLLPSFKGVGDDGWELAASVSIEGGGAYFIFKRQR